VYFGEVKPESVGCTKMIGEGNFSYVFEALDLSTHELYAMKVSKGRTLADSSIERVRPPRSETKRTPIKLVMTDDDFDDDEYKDIDDIFGDQDNSDDPLFDPEKPLDEDDVFLFSKDKKAKGTSSPFVRDQSGDMFDEQKPLSYAETAVSIHTPPQSKKAKTDMMSDFSLDPAFSGAQEEADEKSTVAETRVLSSDELVKDSGIDLGPILAKRAEMASELPRMHSYSDPQMSVASLLSLRGVIPPFTSTGMEGPGLDHLPDARMMVEEAKLQSMFQDTKEIVQVKGCWRNSDSRICMLMELCGPSLRDLLNRIEEPLPVKLYISYFKDMARALCALRAKGVLHKDIKPDNIFLAPVKSWREVDLGDMRVLEEKFPHVKLGDFGVALEEEKAKEEVMPDGDGKYASKEFMDGCPSYACDMFSLGLTMFELAIPELILPLNGPRWEALRNDDVDTRQWTYSHELLEIVKLMLSSKPDLRPTPEALCGLLDKITT